MCLSGAREILGASCRNLGWCARLDPTALTGLYLFAILPVAIAWGFRLAGVVALASFVVTFSYFFLPPRHSFAIAQREAAAALVITLVTAYVVSELDSPAGGGTRIAVTMPLRS